MNDEAAEPRGPSTPGAGPQGSPAPSDPPTAEGTPGGNPPPNANVPPWLASAGAAFTRQQLVRPRNGRYVAGVCGALARATNTDPVLWRVLLAVLGILGGTGVLLYLIGWLIIPSEGDTASPIESLLGKGRSGMAPVSVVLLGGAALLTFAFIVNSGARASMLAAAVIIGAFLLIKRGGVPGRDATFPAAAPSAPPFPPTPPAAEEPTMAFTPPPAAAPPTEPVTTPPAPPRYEPPTSGFRPPFAPHGPYASSSNLPPQPPVPAPAPVKPPKPPKERSILGRLTFFAVLLAMGVVAVLDMAGVGVAVSAYFAVALTTIALGLIVGTWFGRARGLIVLAVLVTFGLVVSTGVERFGQDFTPSVYRPASLAEVADRYDFTFGNVTLDLRQVDFSRVEQSTTVTMKLGQLRVLLPPEVDTTADVQLDGGRTLLFGEEFNDPGSQSVTDLGTDGAGGGTLLLNLQMEAGNLEVAR